MKQVIGGKLVLFVFLHVPSVRSDAVILTELREIVWRYLLPVASAVVPFRCILGA